MKRNTVVLGITLFLLAAFGWAGWANWEYRKQAAEKMLANATQGELVAAGSTDEEKMYTSSPLIGKPAPNFTLPDIQGKKISLADYKGKALLINFWATWCAPCKLETPWIVELRNKYAPKGFEVLSIDSEGDEAKPSSPDWTKDKKAVMEFARQMHMDYPVLLDGDSLSHPYGGLEVMPTTFYVDRSGKVIAAQMGITSKEEMETKIRRALGEGQ